MEESDSNSVLCKLHHTLNYKGGQYIVVSLNKTWETLWYKLLTLAKACVAGAGAGDGDSSWEVQLQADI